MRPRGTPTLGSGSSLPPEPEVLGTITNPRITDPTAGDEHTNTWDSSGVTVQFSEPPPPWETDPEDGLAPSDARRYVDVPENWVLRWINPRLLDQLGWRDWQPVMKSDPRVKIKVSTMVSPEGNIRRGGFTGDILGWMYLGWVISRRKQHQRDTDQLTDSAVNQQQELREQFARRGLKVDGMAHPRFTSADGREMRSRGD